jgi:predicted  nucleic acid-binding Zn-ribbon protein
VKRALQSDEQEALTLLDQVRKMEDRLEEVEAAYGEAQELLGPARDELIAKRDGAKEALAALEAERESFTGSMEAAEIRMYEAIQKGGRRVAVAELTEDGACGHCFGMVPLQLQNEIRHGAGLIRCEACGVILAAPDPDAPAAEAAAPAEEETASAEVSADGAAEGDENSPEEGQETTEEVSAEG